MRILPSLGRRSFDDPLFYQALRPRIALEVPLTVDEAQDQLVGQKQGAREIAVDPELWAFAAGVARSRDRARLALHAQNMWLAIGSGWSL